MLISVADILDYRRWQHEAWMFSVSVFEAAKLNRSVWKGALLPVQYVQYPSWNNTVTSSPPQGGGYQLSSFWCTHWRILTSLGSRAYSSPSCASPHHWCHQTLCLCWPSSPYRKHKEERSTSDICNLLALQVLILQVKKPLGAAFSCTQTVVKPHHRVRVHHVTYISSSFVSCPAKTCIQAQTNKKITLQKIVTDNFWMAFNYISQKCKIKQVRDHFRLSSLMVFEIYEHKCAKGDDSKTTEESSSSR